MQLRDLINIVEASEKLKIDVSDILFDVLEGSASLYSISKKDVEEIVMATQQEWVDQLRGYIDVYDHVKAEHVQIVLGQILEISEKGVKDLLINNRFSEVELYRSLLPDMEGGEFEYRKTSKELCDMKNWVDGRPNYPDLGFEDVYVMRDYVEYAKSKKDDSTYLASASEGSSKTALKVIGLLMNHLAKSPKYASGTSPNKSQIKELLLDLAEEQQVNAYGLSKVDERLLAEAMKYLETQKL